MKKEMPGRSLAAIAWVLRRRLLGTNVGRWDYLGSLIEMWKDDPEGVFPDPQSIGMASPNMIAYQRYNALIMLMAGMKNNELSTAAPIGGMAAVMIYPPGDAVWTFAVTTRLALRGIAMDKLRERILGLMFVPGKPLPAGQAHAGRHPRQPREREGSRILTGRAGSPVPKQAYVAAGKCPLRAIAQLQSILDAPRETVDVKGKPLPDGRRAALATQSGSCCKSCGILNAQGRITPRSSPGQPGFAGKFYARNAGNHLWRAEGRRRHRAHPARVLHGCQLRLPDPERQLRGGDRRL